MAVACDEADGGASSARRRRERRLRAFWRHETFAVQCAIAAATQLPTPTPPPRHLLVYAAPAPVADRVTYAETVEEVNLETPLPAEPAPVTAPVVDAPVFVAPVPAVSCAAPTPEVEFRAPAPAVSCAAPIPEVEFVAPSPPPHPHQILVRHLLPWMSLSLQHQQILVQYVFLWLSTSLRHPSSPTRRRLRWSGGLDLYDDVASSKRLLLWTVALWGEMSQLVSSPRNQSYLLLSRTFLLLMMTKLLLRYG